MSALKSSLSCQAVVSQVISLLCHAERKDPAVTSRCSKADSSSVTLQPPHCHCCNPQPLDFPTFSSPRTKARWIYTEMGEQWRLTQTGWMLLCLTQQGLTPNTKPALQWERQLWQEFVPAATSNISLILCHLWTTISSEDKPGNEGSQGLQMPNGARKPLIISVISF